MAAAVADSRIFDVVVMGSGVIGSSVAYHLARLDPGLAVALVEKDPSFSRASSALSVGNARIQFSLAENIEISRHALDTFERFADEMEVDGERPNLSLKREGNLFLFDAESSYSARDALALQRRLGCEVEWWTPEEIVERVPDLRPRDLVGGTYSARDGHLDGYALLMGYRRKALALGVVGLVGRVDRILRDRRAVTGLMLEDGRRLEAGVLVNCTGAWAAGVLETVGIRLPVEPVQRQVFVVEPQEKPPTPLPLITLPSGFYFRSEGSDRLLVGRSFADDRRGFDLRWQESRFTERLWPELVGLAPAFEHLRFERGWAGLYAVNKLDGNAILGEWPELPGLYLANGFSGHGLQQAPAVGRYLAELILERRPALDLSAFSPGRILEGRGLEEPALI